MPRIPRYDSADVIHQAEHRAEHYVNVDLRSILRDAFIVEDGLRAYLHYKHGCAFAEFKGKFSMIATRGKDKGVRLAKDVDFLAMLEIALKRTVEE